MRKTLLSALFAAALALPAGAQIQGVLVEPRHPTTSDRIRLTVVGLPEQCLLGFAPPVYEIGTGSVVLHAQMPECARPLPGQPAYLYELEAGPLPAGLHHAEVRIEGLPGDTWRELFAVREDTGELDLGEDDRFQVSVHWSNPHDGSSGAGHARRLARDSGAFWFFTQDNLEVTVKILDGRAINGHWWVFIASMTDLAAEIRIGRKDGTFKTYVQAAGANRNFIDVNAFEEGPPPPAAGPAPPIPETPAILIEPERPGATDPVRVEVAVLNTEDDLQFDGLFGKSLYFHFNTYAYPAGGPPPEERRITEETTVGPLAPGVYSVDVRRDFQHFFGRTFEVGAKDGQLRLQDTEEGYFNVYVNLDGRPLRGVGYGVTLSPESGYFWFVDPDNIELTVKILDGRAVNGKYWVFIASMTDVGFTVEVERCASRFDPFGCGSQIYRSVPGVNRNFIDVNYP